MMGVKMHERLAIDHGSVFHGVLRLDHKCEGHDSFKKERRRLELKMNKSSMCSCCERSPQISFFCIQILSFVCVCVAGCVCVCPSVF